MAHPMSPKTRKKLTPEATKGDMSARQKEAMEVGRWRERWQLADRIFKKWERRFQCSKGWEWYEGYQGTNAHLLGDPEEDRYIINLIYPTVEVKIPTLYFHNPKATVVPRLGREDDALTFVSERARLREDTCNTFMQDPRLGLKSHTNLSLKESFFYFGMIEVGYTASYISNPNVGKPILEGDKPLKDWSDNVVTQPAQLTEDEQLFIKRIDPGMFRVSARATHRLEDADWSGYMEWVYASDLKRDPLIDNRDKVKSGGKYLEDYTGKIDLNENLPEGQIATEDQPTKQGMVLIARIWDHRTNTRFIFPVHEGDYYLQRPVPYDVYPFAPIKHHERKEGWYPMPPHFNWLSPQAELNHTREMQKLHRKRMIRRFQMPKGAIDAENLSKMETGGDGVVVETNGQIPAIIPIEDAPLDFAVHRNVPQSKEDFMEITATGSDQRQGGSAAVETATQATVIETRARIRESFSQSQVATWVSTIAEKILRTIEAHMTLPFWIMRNVDPLGQTAALEAMRVIDIYHQITAEELGPLNYDVTVAAENLSPINEDLERQRFGEVMQILTTNPIAMLMLRTSDGLLRKFLGLYGMRNEKLIQQIKMAIEIALLAQTAGQSQALPTDQGRTGENAQGAAAAASGGGTGPGGITPATIATGPSGGAIPLPGLPGAVAQLRAQVGL